MEPAVGVEGWGALASLLAIGAVACLGMAGSALWNHEAGQAESGEAPPAPAGALLLWLSLAGVATAGAAVAWSLMPEADELQATDPKTLSG